MTEFAYEYSVRCPGYKTTYFRSFMGAYERAIKMLHADDEIPEIHFDYGPESGLGIWERTADGGWHLDSVNTNEAWREVAQAMSQRSRERASYD